MPIIKILFLSAGNASTHPYNDFQGQVTLPPAPTKYFKKNLKFCGVGLDGAGLGGVELGGAADGLAGPVHWVFFFFLFIFD